MAFGGGLSLNDMGVRIPPLVSSNPPEYFTYSTINNNLRLFEPVSLGDALFIISTQLGDSVIDERLFSGTITTSSDPLVVSSAAMFSPSTRSGHQRLGYASSSGRHRLANEEKGSTISEAQSLTSPTTIRRNEGVAPILVFCIHYQFILPSSNRKQSTGSKALAC